MPGLLNSVTFQDFVTATNEHVISDPKDIISEAQKNSYALGDMLKGKSNAQIVKAGKKLTDRIQLTGGTSFGFYDPNDVQSPNIQNGLTNIEVPWRFALSCWGWVQQEVELNEGDQLAQYKSVRDSRRQESTIDMYNGMEDALWATPDATTMENQTGSGGRPYSIRAFITEDGNMPAGFSTLMQVDATKYTNWKNQTFPYAYGSIDTSLVPSFDNAYASLEFRSPDTTDNYFKETKFNKFAIWTNKDGRNIYARLTRSANDRAISTNGRPDLGFAVADLVYSGIPLRWASALENVGYSTGQPRFFWTNSDYLFPVFHSNHYMKELDPMNGGIGQPFTWVVYRSTWYQIFCRSRRRLGIIVPSN